MRKIIYASLLSILFVGCYSLAQLRGNTYSYSHRLIGENTDLVKTTDNTYEDKDIKIAFSFGLKELDFELFNKTENPIKVIWDEASFIPFGEGKKVFHKGVKYIDRNNAQVPTTIPSKTSLSDLICPTDNVYYRQGYYGTSFSSPGGWETYDLWLSADMNKPENETMIMKLKGLKYKVLLPMEVNGSKKNYTFEFEISDISKSSPVTQ